MRYDLDHTARGVLSSFWFDLLRSIRNLTICEMVSGLLAEIYLLVFTIAQRREPFAKTKLTLVSLELIGTNLAILPVIPEVLS